MEKIRRFIERSAAPLLHDARRAFRSFTKRQYALFIVLFCVLAASTVGLVSYLNRMVSIEVPAEGGSLSEGIVGTPRFVNPILAYSDADKDLAALVFSGLTRRNADGTMVPDLAEEYAVSEDGLVYTFTIREDAEFHDGKDVTADDVILTIERLKDPLIKSPKRTAWEGVTASKADERTIVFSLKQPYATFIEQTDLGILPAHLWEGVTADEFSFSDLNTEAVGSGPYKVDKIRRRSSGAPETYELARFKDFALGKPFIKRLTLRFYPDERELVRGFEDKEFEQMSAITPGTALALSGGRHTIQTATLPRVFGLFFNQNEAPIFTDKNVARAFDLAINRERIIKEALYGYGIPLDGPLPEEADAGQPDTAAAKSLLEKNGWKANEDGILEKKFGDTVRPLSFSISTSDVPELRYAAEMIKEDIEKVGASVEVKVFDVTQLNQNVIRPRKYEALFFGQIIASRSDLYAFWHSSQRNDPGLNVSLYTSTKVDSILENSVRTLDPEEREKLFRSFEAEIGKDAPAVFVYAPQFIYIVSDRVKGFSFGNIVSPSDRFRSVHTWYIETDLIWKLFNR